MPILTQAWRTSHEASRAALKAERVTMQLFMQDLADWENTRPPQSPDDAPDFYLSMTRKIDQKLNELRQMYGQLINRSGDKVFKWPKKGLL